LKLNGTRELLVYADDVTIQGRSVYTIKGKTEVLVVASKESGREKMLIKLSTWSCLEVRMQDEVII
jgi:hypothetical protein